MHVRHSLARSGAVDLHDHDARHLESALYGRGHPLRGTDASRGTVWRQFEQSFGGFASDHQGVAIGLRHQIHEGKRVRILKDLLAR